MCKYHCHTTVSLYLFCLLYSILSAFFSCYVQDFSPDENVSSCLLISWLPLGSARAEVSERHYLWHSDSNSRFPVDEFVCFRTSHHCTLDPVIYGLRMRELRESWRHLAAMIRSPVDGRLWLGRRRRHAINHDITQLSNLIMSINHYHLQNTSFAQRSQWSSSSIYSTIPSRESVSDSWYLFTARRYAAVSGCPLHLSVICNQSVRHKLMFSHNGGTYLCATNFTAFIDSTLWNKKNKTTNSCP